MDKIKTVYVTPSGTDSKGMPIYQIGINAANVIGHEVRGERCCAPIIGKDAYSSLMSITDINFKGVGCEGVISDSRTYEMPYNGQDSDAVRILESKVFEIAQEVAKKNKAELRIRIRAEAA